MIMKKFSRSLFSMLMMMSRKFDDVVEKLLMMSRRC
jgi:hypothetical protein